MEHTSISSLASFIWSVADLLRGDFKQSQYGRIILPFTVLRRLECVLETNKEKVLAQFEATKDMAELAREKLLLNASGQSFYNVSKMDLTKLGETNTGDNLDAYVRAFSKDAREIFEHFNFVNTIYALDDANLLYQVVKKFRGIDLSPDKITNYQMGLVFEELIRRFAESSNETAGEHFIMPSTSLQAKCHLPIAA
ncbi:type I restriction-modification system subunit M N-terminal domain-containing protein [Shewanella indica]|uniref:type I restriction-modification system subunit M N-terminal domain-containing protein n=1 Tax=Shewanella indica TaxID=768528 RepID=UPI003C72D11A